MLLGGCMIAARDPSPASARSADVMRMELRSDLKSGRYRHGHPDDGSGPFRASRIFTALQSIGTFISSFTVIREIADSTEMTPGIVRSFSLMNLPYSPGLRATTQSRKSVAPVMLWHQMLRASAPLRKQAPFDIVASHLGIHHRTELPIPCIQISLASRQMLSTPGTPRPDTMAR